MSYSIRLYPALANVRIQSIYVNVFETRVYVKRLMWAGTDIVCFDLIYHSVKKRENSNRFVKGFSQQISSNN